MGSGAGQGRAATASANSLANARRAAATQAIAQKAPTTSAQNKAIHKAASRPSIPVKQQVGKLVQAGASGIPFVGPLLSEGLSQLGIGGEAPPTMPSGKGGSKGVQLIDAKTGLNLGVISRRKALGVLTRRGRSSHSPPRRQHPPDCRCGRCH